MQLPRVVDIQPLAHFSLHEARVVGMVGSRVPVPGGHVIAFIWTVCERGVGSGAVSTHALPGPPKLCVVLVIECVVTAGPRVGTVLAFDLYIEMVGQEKGDLFSLFVPVLSSSASLRLCGRVGRAWRWWQRNGRQAVTYNRVIRAVGSTD